MRSKTARRQMMAAGESRGGADSEDDTQADTALMRPQVGRIIIDQLRRIDFEPYRLVAAAAGCRRGASKNW